MRTSVMVAKVERRGSLSSPASMALISWRISPATRSWRWPATVIRRLYKNADPSSPTRGGLPGIHSVSLIFVASKHQCNLRKGIVPSRDSLRMTAMSFARSEDFESVVDEVAAKQIFRFLKHGLERLLEVRLIVREAHHAHLSALPGIVVIEFGDGHVEARAQAFFQAAQDLAFVFQGMRVRDVNFQGQQADRHGDQLETMRSKSQLQIRRKIIRHAKIAPRSKGDLVMTTTRRTKTTRWLRRGSASAWRSI